MRRVALYELIVFLGYLGTLLLLSALGNAFAIHDHAGELTTFLLLFSVPFSFVASCVVAFVAGRQKPVTFLGFAVRLLLAISTPILSLNAWLMSAISIWGC